MPRKFFSQSRKDVGGGGRSLFNLFGIRNYGEVGGWGGKGCGGRIPVYEKLTFGSKSFSTTEHMNSWKLTQDIVFYFKFVLGNMAPFLPSLPSMSLLLLVNIHTERTVKLGVGGFKRRKVGELFSVSISRIFTSFFYFILLLCQLFTTLNSCTKFFKTCWLANFFPRQTMN